MPRRHVGHFDGVVSSYTMCVTSVALKAGRLTTVLADICRLEARSSTDKYDGLLPTLRLPSPTHATRPHPP